MWFILCQNEANQSELFNRLLALEIDLSIKILSCKSNIQLKIIVIKMQMLRMQKWRQILFEFVL